MQVPGLERRRFLSLRAMKTEPDKIPSHVGLQFAEYQAGRTLERFRPDIERLTAIATRNAVALQPEILFMLAVLTLDAHWLEENDNRARRGAAMHESKTLAEMHGYLQVGEQPDEGRACTLAEGRQAIETFHKAAQSFSKRLLEYTELFEAYSPRLPLTFRQQFPFDFKNLQQIAKRHVKYSESHWFKPDKRTIAIPKKAEGVALVWWCYLFPFKSGYLTELYDLAKLWKVTRAATMASFVSNLHRITAPVEKARKMTMPTFLAPRSTGSSKPASRSLSPARSPNELSVVVTSFTHPGTPCHESRRT